MKIEFAVASGQGRRKTMEDAFVFVDGINGKPWVWAGVFDGHGSALPAKRAAEEMHRHFFSAICRRRTPEESFRTAYRVVDADVARFDAGTTAATLFLRRNVLRVKLYVANVGDSRILVVNEQPDVPPRQLTIDDRVDNLEEMKRVTKAGGFIDGQYVRNDHEDGLMMTRSLGDPRFRSAGVIPEPHVNRYELRRNDRWIVLGCDGLFDFATNAEVATICRQMRQPGKTAEELKTLVLNERSGLDNLTVIVLAFQR